MGKTMLKRIISVVLTLALVVTAINVNWDTVSGEEMIVTDGQIIVSNYEDLEFTDAEKAVLESSYIRGESHVFVAPTAEDELLTVDSTAKTIVAAVYEDGENIWEPVEAVIKYDGGSEKVTLEDGKGSFSYAGNDYSVAVTYKVSVNVENQDIIANIPYYLAKGVDNLEVLADSGYTYLYLMESIIPNMLPLVDGSLGLTLSDGLAKTAINELNAQLDENGILDLTAYVEGYNASASKVQYLMENGAATKACLVETYDYVKAIAEDQEIADIIEKVAATGLNTAIVNKVNRAMTQFKNFVEAMADVYADEWKALEVVPVKEGADYAALDTLVAAVGKNSERTFEVKNPLVAATTVIEANVNRYNVTVKLAASIIPANQADSAELRALDEVSTIVTLPSEATKADILAAIEASGIEKDALATWACISEENYNKTVSELPDTLTEDIVYTISYAPKTFELTFTYDDTLNKTVPYGYNLTLAAHEDSMKAYDYEVNGTTYMQNAVYTVKADTTVSRTEGKARTAYTLAQILANDNTYSLTAKEIAILESAALISDTIGVRDFEESDDLEIDGQTVTAKTYDAGYNNLEWIPVTANVVSEDAVIESVDFDGNSATFAATNYDEIKVDYALVIKTGNDAEVLYLLNLPKELTDEAEAQKAVLNQLLTPEVYDNLGSINKTMLNAMAGNLGDESKAAIDVIKAEAFNDTTGVFYLYEYLTAYKNNGLTYYYQDGNYAKINEQVNILADQLKIVAEDELLPGLLEDLGYGEYKDKIDKVVVKLDSMKESFTGPDAAIDTESTELDALVDAFNMSGTVNSYSEANGLKLDAELSKTAETKGTVKITVSVNGKSSSASYTYNKGTVLTQSDIDKFTADIASLEAQFNFDKKYYESSVEGTLPVAGDEITGNVNVVYTWTPKTYIVLIDGEENISFNVGNTKIVLPACAESGYVYNYTIGSKIVTITATNNTYTFTTDEIDSLFVNGTYTITREKVDINRQNVEALVEDLNAALAAGGATGAMAFIPLDVNGNIEIVLRTTVGPEAKTLTSAATGLIETILTSKYAYIGMDGNPVLNEGMISVQAVIDTLVGQDGLGTQTILDLIDENGNINELSIADATLISTNNISNPTVYGGELFDTTLQLAATANATAYEVPLHITVEDFDAYTSELAKGRKAVAKAVNYVTVECKDDVVNTTVTLPDDAYAAILAEMLVTGNVDIKDISDISVKEILDYNYSIVEPVLKDENLTINTLENTINKFGLDVDLNQYDAAATSYMSGLLSKLGVSTDADASELGLKVLRHALNNVKLETVTDENSTWAFDASYNLGLILDKLTGYETYTSMIVERNSDVTVPVKLELTNIDKEYEAIILDDTKEGKLDKVTLTDDAVTAIANAGSKSIVMLLDDVDGTLVFNNSAVIDLNGKNISNGITANATVAVFDSNLVSAGTVKGDVSGSLRITAGKYEDDVTSMIPDGYEQVNGEVVNRIYDIVEDANGNYTILLDADFMNTEESTQWKFLAAEMALDVAMSAYTWGSLSVDGDEIYGIDIANLINSYKAGGINDLISQGVESINCDGVETLANKLLADITNFAEIAAAIGADSSVASYDLVTAPWAVELSIQGEGADNYIDGSITTSDNTVERTLTVKVVGTDEEKAELKTLCEHLDEVVVINALAVEVNDITYVNRDNITVDASGDVDVTLDFSVDNNYAVAIGVILANNTDDNTEIVSAIKKALSKDLSMDELVAAIEAYSLADVIAAMKAAQGVEFDTMLSKLGVTADDAKEIEAVYHDLLNVIYAVLNKLNITGNSVTLADCKVDGSYATYEASKENFYKTDVKVTLILAKEIEDEEPTPTPSIIPELVYTVKYDGNGSTSGTMEDSTFIYNYFSSDQKLKANEYKREFTVTLVYNDGETADETITVASEFKCWENADTSATYSDQWILSENLGKPNSEVTLKASWTDSTYKPEALNDKNGYKFIGWFTADGTQVTDEITVSDNITLTAKWELIPTPTPEPTPVVTDTPEPTPVVTDTPEPTPVVTDTPEPTPVVTDTPSPTPEVTDTPEPTPVVTDTPSPTPEVTDTPSPTPEVTDTPSPTPEVTDTPSPTPEVTDTPSPTPEVTDTPSPTPEVTDTPSPTPEVTDTPSPTPEVTDTPAPTDDPWIWGDIDHNGLVDARDALLALKHAAKLIEVTGNAFYYGDVNQDGILDAKDARAILHYAAKFIDKLPVLKPTLGDVDRDGDIDPVDALLVLKYAAKIIKKFDEDPTLNDISKVAAEVTFDGAISAPDALEILKYAARLITEFKIPEN